MKKLLIALGMVCVTLLVAGCGPSTDKSSQTSTQDSGDNAAAASDEAAGSAAE